MLSPQEVIKNFSADSGQYVSFEQVRLANEGYSSKIENDMLIVDREDMAMPVFFYSPAFSTEISQEVSKFLGED